MLSKEAGALKLVSSELLAVPSLLPPAAIRTAPTTTAASTIAAPAMSASRRPRDFFKSRPTASENSGETGKALAITVAAPSLGLTSPNQPPHFKAGGSQAHDSDRARCRDGGADPGGS